MNGESKNVLTVTADLTGDELVAIHSLALLGAATMTGKAALFEAAMRHLAELDVKPSEAQTALEKLKGTILMAAQAMREAEGNPHAV